MQEEICALKAFFMKLDIFVRFAKDYYISSIIKIRNYE